MSCDGADSVAIIRTSAKRIKDGKLRRYKDKLFGDKWPEAYAVLYQDSTFIWYDDESERTPRGSVQLKDYAPFLAVGVYSTRLPDRPALPSGAKIDHVIAIGTGASPKSKIHWFLCSNDEDLTAWMSQIVSTLPPPPPPQQQQQPQPQMAQNYNQVSCPPSLFQSPSQTSLYSSSQNHISSYPIRASPDHATIVVQQSNVIHRRPDSREFAMGVLAGGASGYGFSHPLGFSHWGCGFGWGYPPSARFSAGFSVYDHDTSIVNNYHTSSEIQEKPEIALTRPSSHRRISNDDQRDENDDYEDFDIGGGSGCKNGNEKDEFG